MSRSQSLISKIRSSLGQALLLWCGLSALSVHAATPLLTAGETVTAENLELNDIFQFDNLFSSAVIYGLRDMSKVKGVEQDLLDFQFDREYTRFRSKRSVIKENIIRKSENCNSIFETFARKDCLADLLNYIGMYGTLASNAKFLELPFQYSMSWDERRQAMAVTRVGLLPRSAQCFENSACAKVGEYGSGDYVLCYRLAESPISHDFFAPLPESEARQLSAQFGGISALEMRVFSEVIRPAKMLDNFRQCTSPGHTRNKLVAEGVIRPVTVTFGRQAQIGYVYSGVTNDASKASQSSNASSDPKNIAPLRAVPMQPSAKDTTPNAKRILIDVK